MRTGHPRGDRPGAPRRHRRRRTCCATRPWRAPGDRPAIGVVCRPFVRPPQRRWVGLYCGHRRRTVSCAALSAATRHLFVTFAIRACTPSPPALIRSATAARGSRGGPDRLSRRQHPLRLYSSPRCSSPRGAARGGMWVSWGSSPQLGATLLQALTPGGPLTYALLVPTGRLAQRAAWSRQGRRRSREPAKSGLPGTMSHEIRTPLNRHPGACPGHAAGRTSPPA
jgi:hypothetical protein